MKINRVMDSTMIKFAMVGAVNTLFGSALMFGLYNWFGCSYWVSSAANYFFTSILSFFLNKRFTFDNKEKGMGVILRFALNIALCYTLSYAVAKPVAAAIFSGLGKTATENISMLVGMSLFVILNYLGQRNFAFKKQR